MTVDFDSMCAAGWSAVECAAVAEARGMGRLPIFKKIRMHWGPDEFTVNRLENYGVGYPSRAAGAAATVGLAALVLSYPNASFEEFADFDLVTGISRKVDALARVDRPDDALGFYDRLDPTRLALTPLSEADARAAVRSLRASSSQMLSVVVDSVAEFPWGWLFAPQLAADRGPQHPIDLAVDARPVIFDRFTGVAIEVESDEAPEKYIRRYEETGWPVTIP